MRRPVEDIVLRHEAEAQRADRSRSRGESERRPKYNSSVIKECRVYWLKTMQEHYKKGVPNK